MADGNRNRNMGAAVTGLVGVAVGAVAATLLMSNKNTRKKMENKMDEWKKMGKEKMEEMREKIQAEKKIADKKMRDAKDEAKKYREDFDENQ